MKSTQNHQFSQVPKAEIPRSVFDRSHGYKTTFNEGYLVPFFVDEALPGDTFRLNASLFARLCTPIVPFMDNLFLETFYFAVPYRLLWDNWKKFNGEQVNPGDSTDFLIPRIELTGDGAGQQFQLYSLGDYFGLPILHAGALNVNALPFRAYNLIYNEWFRDENLQPSAPVITDNGPDIYDPTSTHLLRRRGKRHDYFTSCLPWPQKGPGVELPLGGTAPVIGNGKTLGLYDGTNHGGIYNSSADGHLLEANYQAYNVNVGSTVTPSTYLTKAIGVTDEPDKSGLIADLSGATAATINTLRQAFQLQRLYERDARGGTRYTEIIRAHFGVVSPDARLQRPEYLGGSSTRINVNPVQQTSATSTGTPQGNLAAFGVASDQRGGFSKSFTEHTFIIGLLNVRADQTYQYGVNRMWSRRTRFDHYWPALSHLGEQAVLNQEIFLTLDDDTNAAAFGYQERFAEYRYKPSQITGAMRSNAPQSLDYWHLAQAWSDLPGLNDEFIVENPPIARVSAVESEPHFKLDSYIELHCARPMPVYSVPGLIDHF